jgi:prepilin-type N-terminal cleavage/methylation domain-containing protein
MYLTQLDTLEMENERRKVNKKLSGYTLVEILLTVALIAMVAGFSVPLFQSFLFQNQVATATTLVTRAVRSAQAYSQGVRGDSAWGVAFMPNGVTLFKGESYSARDSSEDLHYSLQGVTLSGVGEIVFSKHRGYLSSSVTVYISSTSGNNILEINEKGTIKY